MVNDVQIKLAFKKNANAESTAFGKYYLEVMNAEPLSTAGLCEHIMSHGLGVPKSVVLAVLNQVSECLTELILTGQPVKLDGFGTFKLTARSRTKANKNGLRGGVANPSVVTDARQVIEGLKLTVIPDNTQFVKLTSRENMAKASMTIAGVYVNNAGDGVSKKAGANLMPFDVWKTQHPVQVNP